MSEQKISARSETGRIHLSAGRIILTITAIVLAVIASTVFRRPADQVAEREFSSEARVVVTTVQAESLDLVVRTVGRVRPSQEVSLAAEVSGRVEDVLVDIGDHVAEDEVVLRIDTAPYEEAVAEREANLLRAQARMEESEAALARVDSLRGRGAISEREYEAALAQKRAGEADVRGAEAALTRARRQLSDCGLTAPFPGTVVDRHVDSGALVGPERPVLTIANLETVAVEVGLTERELLRVRGARVAYIESSSLPGKRAEGVVDGVAARSDQGTGTYKMRIRVDNRQEPRFLGGMVVQVGIPWDRLEGVTTVPEGAILDFEESPRIFLVEDGKAREVPIEILAQVGERVAIGLRGSLPGENGLDGDAAHSAQASAAGLVGSQVILIGQSSLRNGDSVQVAESR
jgi:RND family efflux transporter MFP subunit